ncbi:MAG: molybdopterin-dependent oxidoreductase [Bacteroidetes bacterium]|nr:molybdopterin-dependent oxidoreductase [Bacteroidota bacterium]MBS1981527.1 molybdopterin-dependent oxidoreductase [Bacteroidota bacterium]
MKKVLFLIVALVYILTFSRCRNQKKSGEDLKNKDSSTLATPSHNHTGIKDTVSMVSTTLSVSGDVNFPLVLTVDSLKKMKVVGLDSLNIVCQSGATTSSSVKSRGVLLKDILEKASIKQVNHKDRNFYIVARATDGYKATFSWGEIFNNPTGNNTYITFEENGQPIVTKGSMILNCVNDIRTGPRHVIWLKSIEVKKVD